MVTPKVHYVATRPSHVQIGEAIVWPRDEIWLAVDGDADDDDSSVDASGYATFYDDDDGDD